MASGEAEDMMGSSPSGTCWSGPCHSSYAINLQFIHQVQRACSNVQVHALSPKSRSAGASLRAAFKGDCVPNPWSRLEARSSVSVDRQRYRRPSVGTILRPSCHEKGITACGSGEIIVHSN